MAEIAEAEKAWPPSGLFENISLTAASAGLASLLVMVGFLVGNRDFDITSLS